MTTNINYVLLEHSLMLQVGDQSYNISKTDERFKALSEAILSKNLESIPFLINADNLLAQEGFTVQDGLVCFKGEVLPSILSNEFLNYKKNGTDFYALVNFWFNLKNRESFKNSEDLIVQLIQCNGYPVTKDGFVIVFKNYRNDHEKINLKNDGATRFYDYSYLQPHYSSFFDKRKELGDLIEAVFGFNTKKLYKMVYEDMFRLKDSRVNSNILNYGVALKDVMTPNNLFLVIEKKLLPKEMFAVQTYQNMNVFFKALSKTKEGATSEKRILNLLSKKYNSHHLEAIANMYDAMKDMVEINFAEIDFADFGAIYEFLVNEQKKLKNPDFALKIDENYPKAQELNNLEVDNLKIVIPKTNYELAEWSQVMSNCIHSYGQRVRKGQCLVMAICDDKGKMLYNIEITGESIRQFNGYQNGAPNSGHKAKILDLLKKKGIIR